MPRNGTSSYSHRTPQQTPPRARSSPQSPPRQPAIPLTNATNHGESSVRSSVARPPMPTHPSPDTPAATAPGDSNPPAAEPSLSDLHPEYRPENIAAVRRTNKGYESPDPEDEPEKIDAAITKLLGILIPKEDRQKFSEFFRKASLETASNMVFRYRYVQDLMDKYAGQPAPFRSTSDYIVSEVRGFTEMRELVVPNGSVLAETYHRSAQD